MRTPNQRTGPDPAKGSQSAETSHPNTDTSEPPGAGPDERGTGTPGGERAEGTRKLRLGGAGESWGGARESGAGEGLDGAGRAGVVFGEVCGVGACGGGGALKNFLGIFR
ncbi:hypothetical protein a10_05581 [Streptomyces acidiscabies]|nr:hypothetical protein a10_05581 [Streptomyces acidiscabies]